MEELARVITNLCAIIPGGIVCFFPSYDYENMVCTKWEKTGVMDKIRKKKQVMLCVCVCVCACVCICVCMYVCACVYVDRYFKNHALPEKSMMY